MYQIGEPISDSAGDEQSGQRLFFCISAHIPSGAGALLIRRGDGLVHLASDLASNAFLNLAPGNNDFVLHAVGWLAEEKGLITITPKDTGFATFLVTPSQAVALLALQVLALPSACLVAGLAMWRHRRRL